MTADQMARLECLKLAHRHDRTAEQVIETAKAYERFVIADNPTPQGPAGSGKDRRGQRS